jgi:nucleotide-binding universal stress UspA family protein
LLVPLDGSPAAEASLPLARRLARGLDAQLVLFRAALARTVPGLPTNSPDSVLASAERYLAGLEAVLRADGIDCRAVVAYGPAAESILDNVDIQRAALIVMSAHGASGDRGWAQGSVAAKVLEGSSAPVLVVSDADAAEVGREILLPHDGGPFDGRLLELVCELACVLELGVTLLSVGETPPALAEPAWPRQVADGLESARLRVRFERQRGDVSRAIVEQGHSPEVAIVVLPAAGDDQPEGFLGRTVVDRVVQASKRPVLVYRRAPCPTRMVDVVVVERERCHNCGRENYQRQVSAADRCPRCGFALRSCANCAFYDGIVCQMDNPWSRVQTWTDCDDFRFRTAGRAARSG